MNSLYHVELLVPKKSVYSIDTLITLAESAPATIETIHLQGGSLHKYDDAHFEKILSALVKCTHLNVLVLRQQQLHRLDPNRYEAFCNTLTKCKNLQVLIFEDCELHNLDDDRFQMLCQAITQCNNLQVLDAFNSSFNNIRKLNEHCFNIFCDTVLKCKNLKKLELKKELVNLFSDNHDRFIRLRNTLLQSENLEYLNLSGSFENVNSRADAEILTLLSGCKQKIKELVLSVMFFYLKYENVQSLCVALSECIHLEVLHLDVTKISTKKTKPLFEALSNSKHLKHLYLSIYEGAFSLTDDCFDMLCDYIAGCKNLEVLDFGIDGLKSLNDVQFKKLCEAVEAGNSIHTMNDHGLNDKRQKILADILYVHSKEYKALQRQAVTYLAVKRPPLPPGDRKNALSTNPIPLDVIPSIAYMAGFTKKPKGETDTPSESGMIAKNTPKSTEETKETTDAMETLKIHIAHELETKTSEIPDDKRTVETLTKNHLKEMLSTTLTEGLAHALINQDIRDPKPHEATSSNEITVNRLKIKIENMLNEAVDKISDDKVNADLLNELMQNTNGIEFWKPLNALFEQNSNPLTEQEQLKERTLKESIRRYVNNVIKGWHDAIEPPTERPQSPRSDSP